MRRLAVGAVAMIVLTSCTPAGKADERAASKPAPTAGTGCPSKYAEPDPRRPKIGLNFVVDAQRATVKGREEVSFTPDLPITELVFRLWSNMTAPAGSPATKVTAAKTGGQTAFALGGETRPGWAPTVLRVPLNRTVPAGQAVSATIEFTTTLAAGGRTGTTGQVAWWATGHPLLAWERGKGWQTRPGGESGFEYSSGEAARYDVAVTAPAGDSVLLMGADPAVAGSGPVRVSNLVARDVSLAVGKFSVHTKDVDGVPVTAARGPGVAANPDAALAEVARSLRALVKLLGPYPYPALTIVMPSPDFDAGIEYPGGFYSGQTVKRKLISHETAHQWFYGMVGNDQGRDPWIDESFASYAQSIVDGASTPNAEHLASPGRVGRSMAELVPPGHDSSDLRSSVYQKGAAMLLAARADAGAQAFDAALRCYVNANAWRIATPADVRHALAALPKATARLKAAGAF